MAGPRWLLPALVGGVVAVVVAALIVVVVLEEDGENGSDADLEAAIAFLEAAINTDIRPSEGDVLYTRLEDDGLDAPTPPVRESWYRIGPNRWASESLHREFDAEGNLIGERHHKEESQLVWEKTTAAGARAGLLDGTQRLVELTDETVTVEFQFAVGDEAIPSQAQRFGIEDAVEEVGQITVGADGIEIERHIYVVTEAGDEITLYRSRQSRDVVADMPAPSSP